MLAKGNRSQQVTDACQAHGGFYLGSIGGPAARHGVGAAGAQIGIDVVQIAHDVRVRAKGVARVHRLRRIARTLLDREVSQTREVAVLDVDLRALGQLTVDVERDLRPVLVVDLHVAHLAHTHTGDAHVVARVEQRGVGEDGVELRVPVTARIGDGDGEQTRGHHRDHAEDDQLDQRSDDRLHLMSTFAPCSAPPPIMVTQVGTSSGALPEVAP